MTAPAGLPGPRIGHIRRSRGAGLPLSRDRKLGPARIGPVMGVPASPVIGYYYVHSTVDDHSRLACSEVLTGDRQDTVPR